MTDREEINRVWLNKIAHYKGLCGEHCTPEESIKVADQWIEELMVLKVCLKMGDLS